MRLPMHSKTSTPALPSYGGIFDFATKEARLAEVVKLTEDPAVWADAKQARELGRERKSLEGISATMRDFDQRLKGSREGSAGLDGAAGAQVLALLRAQRVQDGNSRAIRR